MATVEHVHEAARGEAPGLDPSEQAPGGFGPGERTATTTTTTTTTGTGWRRRRQSDAV